MCQINIKAIIYSIYGAEDNVDHHHQKKANIHSSISLLINEWLPSLVCGLLNSDNCSKPNLFLEILGPSYITSHLINWHIQKNSLGARNVMEMFPHSPGFKGGHTTFFSKGFSFQPTGDPWNCTWVHLHSSVCWMQTCTQKTRVTFSVNMV